LSVWIISVVSGSADRTIRIWNAETGKGVAGPFKGHIFAITSVGFSLDGKRLVSGSRETIRIWNVEMGERVAGPFEGHRFVITSVGFSPDGKRVVSGSDDNTIRIWNAETGEGVAGPFEGHTSWITSVGFSPDGKRIVSGSDDRTIRIWNAEMDKDLPTTFEHQTVSFRSLGIWRTETGDDLQCMAKFHRCHFDYHGWMKGEDGQGLLFGCPRVTGDTFVAQTRLLLWVQV
jgi:WD40 repeat protein